MGVKDKPWEAIQDEGSRQRQRLQPDCPTHCPYSYWVQILATPHLHINLAWYQIIFFKVTNFTHNMQKRQH